MEELDGLVRPGCDREGPEREIEFPPLDQLEQLALVLRLVEHDLDLRVALGEAAEESRDDLRSDALERPDAKTPGVPGLERAHVRLGGEKSRLNRVCVAQENAAGLGERDRPWASGALDQPEADDALQCGDLLRDRGLRVAEALGRLAERALVCDRLEGDEVAEVEAQPAISIHDRRVPSEQPS